MTTIPDMEPPNKRCHLWWGISNPSPHCTALEVPEMMGQELQRSPTASPETQETAEGASGGHSTMSPTVATSTYDPFSVPEDTANPSNVEWTSGSAILEPNVPQCARIPSRVTPEPVLSVPTLSPTHLESDDEPVRSPSYAPDTVSPTSLGSLPYSDVTSLDYPDALPPDLMHSDAHGWIYAPRAAPEVADARMSGAEESPTLFSLSHSLFSEPGDVAHNTGEDLTDGFWVLLNQAPDLKWPEHYEGPFYNAWHQSSSRSWIYGRIGNRYKGMPFAVVKTTWVYEAIFPQAFMYRRYYKGWEKPCGCAAYIWCDGSFPNTGRFFTEMHSLWDFIDNGGRCVLESLLFLREFMDAEVASHKSIGTFRELARRTRRRQKNSLSQFSRRKAVTRELRSVLGLAQGTLSNAHSVLGKRKGFHRLRRL